MKKYLRPLLELSDLRLFVVRYGVNLLVLVEIVLLPILVNPKFYTEIEFLRYAFLMAPIVLLGGNSGYVYLYYKAELDYSRALLFFSVVAGLIFSIAIYLFFSNFLASIAFFLFVLVVSIEKVLITLNKLVYASLYKSFTSFFILSLCGLIYFGYVQIGSSTVYLLGLISGQLCWLLIYFIFMRTPVIQTKEQLSKKIFFQNLWALIKSGFLVNIQSYILVGYFLYDRHIVNQYFPEHASEYSIAFSLSQLVTIALNTIAFSAQQKVGESIKVYSLALYNRSLIVSFALFLILIAGSFIFVFLFSLLLPKYGSFYYSFAIITIFVGGYYLISAFAVIAFYKDLVWSALLIMIFFALLNWILTIGLINIMPNYYINLVKSCILILLSGLTLDLIIRSRLT